MSNNSKLKKYIARVEGNYKSGLFINATNLFKHGLGETGLRDFFTEKNWMNKKDEVDFKNYLDSSENIKNRQIGNSVEEGDFPGFYFFKLKDKIVYVGISRDLFRRLVEHVKIQKPSSASLASLYCRVNGREHKTRTQLMYAYTNFISKCDLTVIPEPSARNRYVYELHLAEHYDCKYNFFETH